MPDVALLTRGLRYVEETALHRPDGPCWATPNRVFHEDASHRLRIFGDDPNSHDLPPVLVIPPEVNQSYIVDFAPEQSLIATLLEHGFSTVAALEWQTATPETAARDIDHSIGDILDAIERLGGRVHLLGVCQGGWESAIAAALEPESLETLTLVAAPIDFHAGQGLLRVLSRTLPMAAFHGLVTLSGRRMRGELISLGFDTLRPWERFWLKPAAVWAYLDDRDWMDRHHRLNDWYRAPKDIPGPLYLQAVRELFKENRLIQNRFIALGRRVELSRITCPVCLVAGQRDHITPPPQLFAAHHAVTSPHVLEVLTGGGHIGTFMGRSELRNHWPRILSWLQNPS